MIRSGNKEQLGYFLPPPPAPESLVEKQLPLRGYQKWCSWGRAKFSQNKNLWHVQRRSPVGGVLLVADWPTLGSVNQSPGAVS